MDARDRYAQITGDYENAYRLLEGDEEGYYYTDKMMERAVGLLDSATDTGEQTYFQTLMEKRGPHTGSFLGGTYGMSPEYGRENFANIREQDDMGKLGKIYQGLQFMTDRRQYPSAKLGMMQGLFDYMVDKFNDRK